MAERERERAHDPQAVGELGDGRRLVGDLRRERRLEGEDLDLAPSAGRRRAARRSGARPRRASPSTPRRCRSRGRSRSRRRPSSGPSATAIESEKKPDAALRVERAVDRIDRRRRRARCRSRRPPRRRWSTVEPFEAREDRALGRRVDRRRVVAALAGADDRLAVGARRQLGEHAAHVLDRCAAEGEPVSQAGGRAGPR